MSKNIGTVVTVDGPAASGKTTLGQSLAKELKLPLIDSGLFYRGLTVAAIEASIDTSDEAKLAELATKVRIELNTDFSQTPEQWKVKVNGNDITEKALDAKIAVRLSKISALPKVREILTGAQRKLAFEGAVAVGRDCGTVVFPNAVVKFYLDAPQQLRALRRAEQLNAKVNQATSDQLNEEVNVRDKSDISRAASPLYAAADAYVMDTSTISIPEMIECALVICHRLNLATNV